MITINEPSYKPNESDIDVALMFSEGEPILHLMCFDKDMLPFLRRSLIMKIGSPSRFDSNSLYYSDRKLTITLTVFNDVEMDDDHLYYYISEGERGDDWTTVLLWQR